MIKIKKEIVEQVKRSMSKDYEYIPKILERLDTKIRGMIDILLESGHRGPKMFVAFYESLSNGLENLGIPKEERYKVIFHVTVHKEFVLKAKGQLPMLDMSWGNLSKIFGSKRKLVFNIFIPREILYKYDRKKRDSLLQNIYRYINA